jgi:hypothetical protein
MKPTWSDEYSLSAVFLFHILAPAIINTAFVLRKKMMSSGMLDKPHKERTNIIDLTPGYRLSHVFLGCCFVLPPIYIKNKRYIKTKKL